MKATTLLLLGALLTGCSSDMLPFSSGQLSGTEVALPDSWHDIGAMEVIQFETNPAEPYSVNLWVIEMDGVLYVHAGANRATWVEHIEQNDQVRLGANGNIYPLRAERVSDADEFARLSEIYKEKYGNYPRNMNIAEIYLYRLLPRST